MPKWVSKSYREGLEQPDGSRRYGETKWIPVNDAAKAHKLAEEAIAAGLYKPKEGESVAEMAAKLKKREAEALKKGIR